MWYGLGWIACVKGGRTTMWACAEGEAESKDFSPLAISGLSFDASGRNLAVSAWSSTHEYHPALLYRVDGDSLSEIGVHRDLERRLEHLRVAAAALQSHPRSLLVFGVQPDRPATGYGYLRRGERVGHYGGRDVLRLAAFVEKPDLARAQSLLAQGLERQGALEASVRSYRQAVALYAGDFLEEDRFADWSVDCREQARSSALGVSRLLAREADAAGDDDGATRQLHRLLELDQYDERAWLALIGAHLRQGHHGEARRQHAAYSRRMAELGVPPVLLDEAGGRRP
jgi:hypothetical protein